MMDHVMAISKRSASSLHIVVGHTEHGWSVVEGAMSAPAIEEDVCADERGRSSKLLAKIHGVGMELSICRSIIDAHEGRLWAEANEPRGAVFQSTLPGA